MEQFDIFNLPPRLFKYYSHDSKLTAARLSGTVFLACPYDFNDPCDCQRVVFNNAADRVNMKGYDWLVLKMRELGFCLKESQHIAGELIKNDDDLKLVHRRMLERLGILCLTSKHSDSLMWGYYTNNNGLCLEYDVTKIVKKLVIGFINNMDYATTCFLYKDDKYAQKPEEKTPMLTEKIILWAKATINELDWKHISNRFLVEETDKIQVTNFIRNILIKRIYAHSIIYNVEPDGSPAPLFFQRGDKASETKYFKKTKIWEHEHEFRFIASLGGRLQVNLGKECIKSVYLGCNMTNDTVAAITYIMAQNELTADLYKMKRLKNGGLTPVKIDWKKYKDNLKLYGAHLDEIIPFE